MRHDETHVLLIEDNAGHARLIGKAFSAAGNSFRLTVAVSLGEARQYLNESIPDLVISDLILPDGRGGEILEWYKEGVPFPLIVMTGYGDEQVAVNVLKAGAMDYIVKMEANLRNIPHIAENTLRRWQDILKRKRAEKALAENEEKFRALIENTGMFLAVADDKGMLTYVSPAVESITGFTTRSMMGQPLANYLNLEDLEVVHEYVRRVKEVDGMSLSIPNFRLRRVEGDFMDMEGMVTNMLSIPGIEGIVLNGRDVTELKKMEERLKRKQKLESIGVLAGGIAHDYNNILTVILGHLSVARITEDSTNRDYSLVEAEEAVFKARNLTQQLLTFAQGGDPVKEKISIKGLLETVSHFSLRGSNVTFKLEIADDLYAVNADKGLLNQALSNLLINADQAMPVGGTVTIRAENTELERQNVYGLIPGKYVRIDIIDTGIGISEEYRNRIFEPYFSTKSKGSGLGLAIVYSIIMNHNGFVDLKSQPGKGTTFYLFLPALDIPGKDLEGQSEVDFKGEGTILVMDNEESIRDVACLLLERLGYKTMVARDGEEALEYFKKRTFDAIILDLTIPGGMGGEETAKRIRKVDPDVVLIVSSGYSNSPVMANAEAFGFNGVLTKPYRLKDVARLMERLLGAKS